MGRRLKYFLDLFEKKELTRAILILICAFVVAVLEIVSLAALMPFFAVVADSGAVDRSKLLSSLYNLYPFKDNRQFLSFLALSVIVLIVVANVFKAANAYINNKFIASIRRSFQVRLLTNYVNRPYNFFLQNNSSELNKIIWTDIEFVISYVVTPLIQIFSNGLMMLFIVLFIAYQQPSVAITLLGFLFLFAFVFGKFVKKGSKNSAYERGEAAKKSFIVLNEALGGIKDVKVFQKEERFVKLFEENSKRYGTFWAKSMTIAQMPRYVLEVVAFSTLIISTLYMIFRYNDMSLVLPLLGLYAFAAYKIIPAAQIIFQALASIKQGWPSVILIHTGLNENKVTVGNVAQKRNGIMKLHVKEQLELQEIVFKYHGAESAVINNLSLTIKANTTVGLVGGTGAGKTTLVDILLGLHKPETGKIFIDNTLLDGTNLEKWKMVVGYVPQQIFLRDCSVKENIAFGIPVNEISDARIKESCKLACIDDFIETQLSDGYDTIIGERGVRLSGGQRQRLGIARALYRQPEVLILDEATSALDNVTESYIIKAIENLKGKCTVIIIAHRLSTIQHCDKIVILENGNVTAEGSYEQLLNHNKNFRKFSLIK